MTAAELEVTPVRTLADGTLYCTVLIPTDYPSGPAAQRRLAAAARKASGRTVRYAGMFRTQDNGFSAGFEVSARPPR